MKAGRSNTLFVARAKKRLGFLSSQRRIWRMLFFPTQRNFFGSIKIPPSAQANAG
jgi:hypothetical protein